MYTDKEVTIRLLEGGFLCESCRYRSILEAVSDRESLSSFFYNGVF